MKKKIILMVLFIGMLSLAGCGVKPGSLQSPSGSETDFPRRYPSHHER